LIGDQGGLFGGIFPKVLGKVLCAVSPGKSAASNDDGIMAAFGWGEFSHWFVILNVGPTPYAQTRSASKYASGLA
jgi:hypothetical protein